MYRFLLLALFLSGFTLSFAQKPVVHISPEFKLGKNRAFEGHLRSDATGHYVYFYKADNVNFIWENAKFAPILEKYDPDFKLLFSKDYSEKHENAASLGIRYFNGQFVWLFSEDNKKEDYVKYSMLPIDLQGKEGKTQQVAKFKYESRKDKPDAGWNTCRDSSKLLFRALVDEDRDDNPFSVFFSVLNKDLSVDWSRKITLRHTEEQVEVLATLLKKDGSVYMIAKIYEGKRAKESKKNAERKSVAAYDMMLIEFTKNEDKPREYRLQLGDSFIQSASLTTDKDDNLKCAGFYSNRVNGSLQGVFYLDLASDGKITASNKKEFTAEELKKFGGRNTEKDRGGDVGLESNFKFSDFLVREDGSAVVVAEENYIVYRYNYMRTPGGLGPTTQTTTREYYSRDIVVFSINPKGEIQRVSVIPKLQIGMNDDRFNSYISLLKGNEVVFIYNEDIDNLKKPVENPKPKRVGSFKDCVTVMTTLGTDGALTRKTLFEAMDDDVKSLFVPKKGSPLGSDQLFFMSTRVRITGRTFHIGTLKLP